LTVIKAASLLVVEDRRRHAEHVMRDRHHGGREVDGLNVAILVADGFEEVELTGPRKALDQAVPIQMWSRPRPIASRWNFTDWGSDSPVDVPPRRGRSRRLRCPPAARGVFNPDTLRIQAKAVAFVKAFFDEVKPVAAICTKGGGQQALFYVLAELPDDLP
jgi:hypothetical protein